MSNARLSWLRSTALLCVAGWPVACRHDSPSDTKRDPAVLDGMELTAARRVGLESAADAMRRGDLKRLQMLHVWVRNRAQVVLFQADDLKSLDLAIGCLDGSLGQSERSARLEQVKSGQLIEPARAACLEAAP